jgi:hypothetical protein
VIDDPAELRAATGRYRRRRVRLLHHDASCSWSRHREAGRHSPGSARLGRSTLIAGMTRLPTPRAPTWSPRVSRLPRDGDTARHRVPSGRASISRDPRTGTSSAPPLVAGVSSGGGSERTCRPTEQRWTQTPALLALNPTPVASSPQHPSICRPPGTREVGGLADSAGSPLACERAGVVFVPPTRRGRLSSQPPRGSHSSAS